MQRRDFLLSGAAALVGLWSREAEASLAISLSLTELVVRSSQVWVGTAVEAHGEWIETKSGRYIVTHTKLQQDSLVTATESEASELWVRTLGGHVGRVGQLVHGEAELRMGKRNLLFLQRADSAYRVTAMAQGQFQVRESEPGNRILAPSSNLPHLARAERSAVKRLAGRELMAAIREIQAVRK